MLDSVGKSFRVADNPSVSIPVNLPAIIHNDIFIANVFHSRRDHGICHAHEHFLADIAVEAVPAIPAHWRSKCLIEKFLLR